MGCSGSLEKETRKGFKQDHLVIALNSSFLLSKHDIHFFADIRFYDKYKNQLNSSLVVTPKNFPLVCDDQFFYNPSKHIFKNITESLKVGHSVLIPALHFSLLLNPENIILFGVSMNNNHHWNGEHGGEQAKFVKFPSYKRVIGQVCNLSKKFTKTKIFCVDRESKLLEYGVCYHMARKDYYKKT